MVILAGIKVSASLVVPFLLAVFLAILLAPPFRSIKRKGMPGAVALITNGKCFVLNGRLVGGEGLRASMPPGLSGIKIKID